MANTRIAFNTPNPSPQTLSAGWGIMLAKPDIAFGECELDQLCALAGCSPAPLYAMCINPLEPEAAQRERIGPNLPLVESTLATLVQHFAQPDPQLFQRLDDCGMDMIQNERYFGTGLDDAGNPYSFWHDLHRLHRQVGAAKHQGATAAYVYL